MNFVKSAVRERKKREGEKERERQRERQREKEEKLKLFSRLGNTYKTFHVKVRTSHENTLM